jgi:hypothetical protein
MNREEAHLDQCTQEHILQAISYLDSDEWLQLFQHPDPSGINNLRIAVSTVLSAIMGMYGVPQPDPITGLVPCGCGGKAKCLHYLTPDGDYAVKCGKCKIMTDWFNSPEDAIKAFNTAMGHKGGAE